MFKTKSMITGSMLVIAMSLVSCNLTPGDTKATPVEQKPDTAVNDLKPRIVKDQSGQVIERYDVTFGANGEVKARNEYHYTYDSRGNRTSEQIWSRTQGGVLISRVHNTFVYNNGLLQELTFVSYDENDQEDSWRQNRYKYDGQGRETEVTLYTKQGLPVSSTQRLYNDKGSLWKEITIEYDRNGKELKRAGLEYSDRGAVVKEF